METADVIKLRKLCEKAETEVRRADGSVTKMKFPTHIVCDNSLNVLDYHNGNVIWNDTEGYFVYFVINTNVVHNSPTNGISFGQTPMVPGAMIVVDYGEIQNLRCELNEEAFDAIAAALNMPADKIAYNKHRLFEQTNADIAIQRRRMYSYSNQAHKNSKDGKCNFTDLEEYDKTIHPVSY